MDLKENYFYENHWSSIVRMINQVIEEIIAEKPELESLSFVDLDAHADIPAIEAENFVGLRGFAVDTEDGFIDITFTLGVSTSSKDEGKFLHRRIINNFMTKLRVNNTFPLVLAYPEDPENNKPYGIMTVTTCSAFPFGKADTKAVQFIGVTALSTETLPGR